MSYDRDDVGIKVFLGEGSSLDMVVLPNEDPDDVWPSVSTSTGATTTDIWVVAVDEDDDLRTWRCDGATAESDCDHFNEWTDEGSFAPDVGVVLHDPHLVTVTISSGVHYRFVLYEDTAAERVRLLKWCDGDTDWTDAGVLPSHVLYDETPRVFLGNPLGPGSSVDVFIADGTMLHGAYIAQADNASGLGSYDALQWTADATDTELCP